MNEIKTTELLAQLIESSREIGNKRNSPVSAEKFLPLI